MRSAQRDGSTETSEMRNVFRACWERGGGGNAGDYAQALFEVHTVVKNVNSKGRLVQGAVLPRKQYNGSVGKIPCVGVATW